MGLIDGQEPGRSRAVKTEEYRNYLQAKGISTDDAGKQMVMVADFNKFLGPAGWKETTAGSAKKEVERYARRLIAQRRNTLDNFSALCDYTQWLGKRKWYVALLETMDCHNAMEVLAQEVERKCGRETRGWIFRELPPPLGTDEVERSAYARRVAGRMAQRIDTGESRDSWFRVQHGIPPPDWREHDRADQEKYRQCGNIDQFLDLKRRERDALLTRLRDENRLWYTVEINDEVLKFVQSDPEMEVGNREGDKIYISKIPYNAVRYLHESDARMKRYHACHCPWMRDSILENRPVSADACYCSLGHASHYLAGLNLELPGEVLESAVKGDTRCRFVFHLPESVPHGGIQDTF
jgi:hypothetical protein